jgi:arsenite-transporting ATPase
MERTIAKYVRPVAKRISEIPIPGEDYFDAIEHLFNRLNGVDRILADPEITTVRLIANPEKIVLKETQRAYMYFCLYKMNIDAIIMNRVLPPDVKDGYFRDWVKTQKQHMKKAEEYFSPVPIFPVNLFKGEVLGYDRLKILAEQIYGQKNPTERFFDKAPYDLIKKDGAYRMAINLPFIEKKHIELNKLSDELIIRIGGFKRHILLPRQVAAAQFIKAGMEGKQLIIQFTGVNHGEEKG